LQGLLVGREKKFRLSKIQRLLAQVFQTTLHIRISGIFDVLSLFKADGQFLLNLLKDGVKGYFQS
jgi:hypothetical protein